MCMDAESRMRITFRIITSLSVNYPILRDWGFAPSRLLCIFTEKGMMQQLKNALFLKNAQVLNPYDGLKSAKKIISETFSAPVLCIYQKSKNSDTMLELLQNHTLNRGLGALPIVISDCIPAMESADVFMCFASEHIPKVGFEWKDVVPKAEDLPIVKDMIRRKTLSVEDDMERTLIAGACFLYPVFPQEERDKKMRFALETVKCLMEADEDSRDRNGLADLFVNLIHDYFENHDVPCVVELPDISEQDIKNFENGLFYDLQFMYLDEKLFENVSRELLNMVPKNVLKKTLLESEILSVTESGTYSCKMNYIDGKGDYRRRRMLRLRRERLNLCGRMDVIDAANLRKEHKNHE